jgi:hypothetical protein
MVESACFQTPDYWLQNTVNMPTEQDLVAMVTASCGNLPQIKFLKFCVQMFG